MALGRSFVTVGGMTLISRVLGFFREIIIAASLGSGADAFYAAFRMPNLFRRIFAEGAFSLAFVPLFTKSLETGEAEARRFGEEALAGLASVLFLLTLVATVAMPVLMYVLAAGFARDPEKFDLAVYLARIMFPYLLLISLMALFSAVLNALGKFAVAAGAPILLNVFLIVFAGGALALGADVQVWLALGVTLSGFAQLALVWHAARKAGMRLALRPPKLTEGVKRLLRLAAPAALSGGAMQINLVIDTAIASFFAGAVSWLSYADRIYQLPLGIVGVAGGVRPRADVARGGGALGDPRGDRAGSLRAWRLYPR